MRIGYARVSTAEQHVERQQQILQELGAEKTFVDFCSGKNTDRPALKEMLDFIRTDDIFIFFFFMLFILVLFSVLGFFRVWFLGGICELERSFILARQREGIEIAKLAGVYKGRKPIDCPDFDKVYQQVELGELSATDAFKKLNISKSSWYRRVRERHRSAGNQSSE